MKDIEILYEDNHVIACVKPVNVLSQSDSTGDEDMLSSVKAYIKNKYNKPGDVFLGLVHRLDRPVGGVMVFARTSKAASRISEQIRTRNFFDKKYLAVLKGIPKERKGEYTDYLLKNERTNTVSVLSKGEVNDKAKEAKLMYEIIETVKNDYGIFTLVQVELYTGRPHQIRVQFASRKTPLFGDMRYGDHSAAKENGLALWSKSIDFQHPTLDKIIHVEKLPPKIIPWSIFGGRYQ